MSSLGAAMYGHEHDDDMFGYNSQPPQQLPVVADGTDTVSTSSYEFTGTPFVFSQSVKHPGVTNSST